MADITKGDIKREANKEVKAYMSSSEFKTKVEAIVKDRIRNEKELEDKVVEITKNVLTQMYKTLWTRRGMIISTLKNRPI